MSNHVNLDNSSGKCLGFQTIFIFSNPGHNPSSTLKSPLGLGKKRERERGISIKESSKAKFHFTINSIHLNTSNYIFGLKMDMGKRIIQRSLLYCTDSVF